MPLNNSKELFVRMLSDVRQRTEHMTKIYQELSGIARTQHQGSFGVAGLPTGKNPRLPRPVFQAHRREAGSAGIYRRSSSRIFGANSLKSKLRRSRPSSFWSRPTS